jgi:hypothetical protein
VDIEKCGTILLSLSKINELKNGYNFNKDMPILTLSLAKKLFNSALLGCINKIKNEIDIINYYLKRSWESYKSHRKKIILKLEEHLKLKEYFGLEEYLGFELNILTT